MSADDEKSVQNSEPRQDNAPAEETAEGVSQSRREAMLRMAKYTAPVMLGMLVSEKAMASTSTPE
jgi:hypothetical protein